MHKKFLCAIVLFFGNINCSALAAVDSFWESVQFYNMVTFKDLNDPTLISELRVFETFNDNPSSKSAAAKTINYIYGDNPDNMTNGYFKLALANLIKKEQSLFKAAIVQSATQGISLSNQVANYKDLLNDLGLQSDQFDFSAKVSRRGIMSNFDEESLKVANYGCIEFVDEDDPDFFFENICKPDQLEAQRFLNNPHMRVRISSGILMIKDKESNRVANIHFIFALDTTNIRIKRSLKGTFEHIDFNENSKNRAELKVFLQNLDNIDIGESELYKINRKAPALLL